MLLVKVLERKWVIRCFGLALALAPFVNIVLSMSLQLVVDKWTSHQFSKIIHAQTTANNILSLASVVIGLTMLSGSKKSWKFALALLGAHILFQVPRLGQDLRSSWIYGIFFLVNIGAFLFIADQLAFKQKKEAPVKTATPKPEPVKVKFDLPVEKPEPVVASKPVVLNPEPIKKQPRLVIKTSKRRILVSFQGGVPWAQLVGLSMSGVEMKGLNPPPAEFAQRPIELVIAKDVILKLKFSRQLDNKFFFDFTEMNEEQMNRLNNWLIQAPKAA